MATRGRPRAFDRDKALRAALDVFRERGYEGTTLPDLQKAMGGLAPPSFYAAFKSKEDLFLEAVELYVESMGSRPARALESGATTRASVEALLNEAVSTFAARGEPKGCLVILGSLNIESAAIRAKLEPMRRALPNMLEARIKKGIKDGDVPKGTNVAAIASFYTTVVHGLALRARDETTRDDLAATVHGAMSAWTPLVTTKTRK
ncbi:MAG TPA: TetR/AcrR family transcriptional regulator [Gemmatimonadaceae bacterium]|nr:TetR/AcrR family transcriptional regulator [Gemmatimonadaceae bacterium]